MSRTSLPRSRIFVAFLLVAISTHASASDEVFSGKCVSVADGDTITVLRDGRNVRVRLEGVDAPERGDAYSQKAKEFTARLAFGKQVVVRVKGLDRYGRTVGRVFVNEDDISRALVRAGLAWHYTKYSDDPELAAAERLARQAKIGIWSLSNPLPPWEQRALKAESAGLAPAEEVVYHGNRRSRVFHGPWCQHYNCKNCTVAFRSREEAMHAGYRPGGRCKP